MNEQIKVGDLVMVVKPFPCGCAFNLGTTFEVKEIEQFELCLCTNCSYLASKTVYAMQIIDIEFYAYPIQCLKKINPPPIAEHEPTNTDLEVTA